MVVRRLTLAFTLTLVYACTSGTLYTGGDSAADASVDGAPDAAPDPCAELVCGDQQTCVEGRCVALDPCYDVVCENPGEVCDPRDGSCISGAADEDGDGVTIAGGDCDDGDSAIHPGATEACDGVDQDCDREIDEGFPDVDGDGYDTCGFGNPAQADCDDTRPDRHPFRAEDCDGVDNDCDEDIDEGIDGHPCSTSCGAGVERCADGAWVCDAPGSCECSPVGDVDEEPCGSCGSRRRTCEADLTWSGWSACTDEGDCAPGSSSFEACGSCGSRERRCGGDCTWGAWGPCEDEGECSPGASGACTTACGSGGTRACDGGCRWSSCTPPPETCNGVDDDCDGQCDEGCRVPVHRSYCPAGHDHFYTTSEAEASCCGCTIEALNYFYVSAERIPDSTELWRCYLADAGDHFYTTSSTCEGAAGVTIEGALGFVLSSPACGATPLYRLRAATHSDHFYTVNAAERDEAIADGWIDEGMAGYVWTSP